MLPGGQGSGICSRAALLHCSTSTPRCCLLQDADCLHLMVCLQGFSLKGLKHLVLDEADKLLDMDFEQEIDQILKVGMTARVQ